MIQSLTLQYVKSHCSPYTAVHIGYYRSPRVSCEMYPKHSSLSPYLSFQPLPEFSRIPGLILPGGAVSDCLMLMQFLRGFGKVLGFDVGVDVPTLGMLQEGLLNVGDSMGHVQDLLVRLLSLAVCDPGLPPGHKVRYCTCTGTYQAGSHIGGIKTYTHWSDFPDTG